MILTFNRKANQKSRLKDFVKSAAMALVISGGFIAITVDDAFAQRTNRNSQQDAAPVEGRQFTSKTGQIVLKAQEFMQADQWSAALGELNNALAIPDINPYERSVISQMQGSAHYELNNYPSAINSFENAINAGGLLPNEASSLRVNIAQLLIASDQFVRGAQMLEDWNRSGGQLKPAHIEMLWQAWSQAEQYARALPWAERWYNAASPKERKHYDLMNFMYNNLGQRGKQADIVKEMIGRWPEDQTLWDTWASMLANGGREQDAFEVSKMLYLGGAYSKEADLLKVVQYYSFYEMPFQAAQILEREVNAGRIQKSADRLVQLSDLYRQAREYKRAIPILEQAAAMSGKPKSYADLGEALYNEGQCGKAEDAFKKAMNLGYDQGKAWMLVANCRYDQASAAPRLNCDMTPAQITDAERSKLWVSAVAAFDNVPGSSREAGNARKWKTFIGSEKKGFEDRCEFKKTVRRDTCFLEIGLAYDNEFLVGEFKLDDETCMEFKPAYDGLYRIKIEDTPAGGE